MLQSVLADAKEKVPSLVLVNGEDLTPYRQASKRIFSVLARFGIAERLGMDEVLFCNACNIMPALPSASSEAVTQAFSGQ